MRLKSKDVAKALGLSPATVSLAVNNKPGVNEKTRQRILDFMDEQEERLAQMKHARRGRNKGTILIIFYIKNLYNELCNEEVYGDIPGRKEKTESEQSGGESRFIKKKGLDSDILREIDMMVSKEGYQIIYLNYYEKKQSPEELWKLYREKEVRGVYLMAEEMAPSDINIFIKYNIPVVAGDNLFYKNGTDSFLIDNMQGVLQGMDYLFCRGHRNIVYLAQGIELFNFCERRRAFLTEIEKKTGKENGVIWSMGKDEETVYRKMLSRLDKGIGDTTAFFLESTVVFHGVLRALRERGVRIPEDISLIGFDADAGSASFTGNGLTIIEGNDRRRHKAAIRHLLHRIRGEESGYVRTYYSTDILEGTSVADRSLWVV